MSTIPDFNELESTKDRIYIRGEIKYKIVGAFIGFDGKQYVAIVKLGWGDKSYLLYDNFVKAYRLV